VKAGDFKEVKVNGRNWERKPCLLISGVGRSGTSFLTRALNMCGVFLGDWDDLTSHEWKPVKYNLRGTWENKKIFELQKKTYSYNDLKWPNDNIWPKPYELSVNEKLGNEIQSYIEELVNNPSLACGFKFNIMLTNAWKDYLPKNLVTVVIFRHPLKVAESAKKLGWRDYPESLRMWELGNELSLSQLREGKGFLINFDLPKNALFSELNLIAQKLGLVEVDFSKWHTEDLRHSDNTFQSNYCLPENISALYSKLIERSKNNSKVEIKKLDCSTTELINLAKSLIIEKLKNEQYIFNSYRELLEKQNKIGDAFSNENSLVYQTLRYYNSIKELPKDSNKRHFFEFMFSIIKPLLKKIVNANKK